MAHPELSRSCIPWTPCRKALEDMRVCLVTSAGVRMASDPPFDVEGDTSYRVIEGTATGADLAYDDSHYDHGCADRDINCLFPIDRLRELAAEERLRGLTDHHYGYGFTMKLRQMRDETFPAMLGEIEKLRPDAVLLTGG